MPDLHSLSHYNPPVSCKGKGQGYKFSIAAELYVCEIIASDSRGGLWFSLLNETNMSGAKSLQMQRLSITALHYSKYMFDINITRTQEHFVHLLLVFCGCDTCTFFGSL